MFTTLHCKGEKALEFGLYLDKVKEMFYIFHDCGKPQPEATILRFLFDTIESPGLTTHTISAIQAQLGQDPSHLGVGTVFAPVPIHNCHHKWRCAQLACVIIVFWSHNPIYR
jgi:hypothetical protein